MILFILVGVVGVGLLVWGLKAFDGVLQGMAGVVFLIALALMCFAAGCEKATVEGQILQVKSLREAAASVDIRQSEDIYGKVADFNVDLAGKKWLNQQWWADPFVPDEWMAVQPIPVSSD